MNQYVLVQGLLQSDWKTDTTVVLSGYLVCDRDIWYHLREAVMAWQS